MTQSPSAHRSSTRRYDLDWLRIAAFALLILYHTGMFYVTWDWHVKSPSASDAIEPLMLLLNPWRLGLLFLVAGAATRFMADRLTPGQLARERFHRLFWPLLFGMLVIVPPQAYLEVVEKLNWPGSYARFMALYLQGYDGFCRGDDCLILPTWNHLWFITYALVYALLLAALLALRPRLPQIPARWVAPLFIIGPWLWLWAMRVTLKPLFETTHALVDDWYNHCAYFPLYLLGFAIARSARIATLTVRVRWPSLIAFAIGYAGAMAMPDDPSAREMFIGRGFRELQAWAAMLACLGFARAHLATADGPARQWLTRAVFPFYIVHQTAIVISAYVIAKWNLPMPLEAALIISATLAACILAAVAAMRWAPLGLLLGVAPARAPKPAPA